MTNWAHIGTGVVLVAAAIAPTPDDLTVVSPMIQLTAGTLFIVGGLLSDKKGG